MYLSPKFHQLLPTLASLAFAVLILWVLPPQLCSVAGVSSRTAHWAHPEPMHILRPCLAASSLSAGRGKATSFFLWPETTHSFSGVLLIIYLLHCP